MKTAIYTICKNEINRIERWFEYAKMFDYICVLDTGSTDGTWEFLKKYHDHIYCNELEAKTFITQRTFYENFDFSVARNDNLDMVPTDVDWCLSADIDEWFSSNVLDEMKIIIENNPDVTNITTTRLDIYSKDVFVGPPNHIPTNKIHKRHHYVWKQPIYEHLWPIDLENQKEYYSDKIFLIHDQDTSKPRSNLYVEMMLKQFDKDKTDCWNNWYLLNHFYREKRFDMYVTVALCFLKFSKNFDKNYDIVYNDIQNIYKNANEFKRVPIELQPLFSEILYKEYYER